MNPQQVDRAVGSVAIIGGGISGLAAAHRLIELRPALKVTLFEANSRLGGVLRTEKTNGYLLEHSADNFITTTPWATDLCRRIGLADQLLPTNATNRRALVLCRGRLEHVPDGFQLMAPAKVWPVLSTPILSVRGKVRLLCEPLIPPRQTESDESLADFVRRRLGREAYERLVQPLVGGIYTADAEKLSVRSTLGRFVTMEQQHGSLTLGLRASRGRQPATTDDSGARYSMFVAPRGGISSLVEALAARLPADTIQINAPVEHIEREDGGRWSVRGQTFDRLIIATPAFAAAALLDRIDAELTRELRQIPYAGCAIVLVGYHRDSIGHALDGFGFVVPEIENRRILAASFSSNKFPGRAPQDKILLRVFVGGARHPELVELDDEQLRQMVSRELSELVAARGEPELFRVIRWRNAMPQYHLGHWERVQRIESRLDLLPGLALAGNAYHGVGIPDCVHSGELAAEAILQSTR